MDPNPDQEGPKHVDPVDPDPDMDPERQHCILSIRILSYLTCLHFINDSWQVITSIISHSHSAAAFLNIPTNNTLSNIKVSHSIILHRNGVTPTIAVYIRTSYYYNPSSTVGTYFLAQCFAIIHQ
jgi:hypothetical protein